jgi:uncharacterized protein (DUF305 family)
MSTFADEHDDPRPDVDPSLLSSAVDVDDAADDETLVLPWWQHPLNIVTMLVATALIAAMIGWLVADATAGPDPNEVDVGFLQDMREHHEQAVGMSLLFLVLDDTNPGLRTVARSIVVGQSIEVGRMIQLLRDYEEDEANLGDTSMTWMGMSHPVGGMPGMASEAQLDELATLSGAEADQLFVDLMVAHHVGGIDMADYAAEHAGTGEVRRMAGSIAGSQRDEIQELQGLLS